MNRDSLFRLRAVEVEYLSCHAALVFVIRNWQSVAAMPEWQGRKRSEAQHALHRLEATYIIRLFSEFEGILRDHWVFTRKARVPNRVETLIDRLGSGRRFAIERSNAHQVQYYRNALVHQDASSVTAVTFGDARRALNRFIASCLTPDSQRA